MNQDDYIYYKPADEPCSVGEFYFHRRGLPGTKANLYNNKCEKMGGNMMALYTKRGYDNILQRIWETGGMTPDMEEDLNRLRAEYDEREGILREYGEEYDGEEETYEFHPKNSLLNPTGDATEINYSETVTSETDDAVTIQNILEWESRYRKLEQRYKDTFFGRLKPNADFQDIMENQTEDTMGDAHPKSYKELLYGANDARMEERT